MFAGLGVSSCFCLCIDAVVVDAVEWLTCLI